MAIPSCVIARRSVLVVTHDHEELFLRLGTLIGPVSQFIANAATCVLLELLGTGTLAVAIVLGAMMPFVTSIIAKVAAATSIMM